MADNSLHSPFEEFLAHSVPHIRKVLADVTPNQRAQATREIQDDLCTYLYRGLAHFVGGKGKLMRPALCILGAQACMESSQKHAMGTRCTVYDTSLLQLACALELFQAAALIHDDIADKSELRRGEPCLYRTYGTGLALNMGDSALVAASEVIAHLSDASLTPEIILALIQEFLDMEHHTIEGQALDLGWAQHNRWDMSCEDYLVMARLKTAHYTLASPLVLGALYASAQTERISEEIVDVMRAFGLKIGVAFQLQDDWLNLFGSKETQGKDLMSDILEGKRTYLTLYALAHSAQDKKHRLQEILQKATNTCDELTEAVQIIQDSGAQDACAQYARTLSDEARDILAQSSLRGACTRILASLCDFVVTRSA